MDDSILTYDEDGQEVLLSDDVRFNLKKSKDSIIRIEVRKEANGSSFNNAKETADKINYGYKVEGNTIILDDFLTTIGNSKFKDQEVRVNLYIPTGTLVNFNIQNHRDWTVRAKTDKATNGIEKYLWKMDSDGVLHCQDCPADIEDRNTHGRNKVLINEDGIDIDIKDNGDSFKMKIDGNGLKIRTNENDDKKKDDNTGSEDKESFEMKIDKDGVNIDSNSNGRR